MAEQKYRCIVCGAIVTPNPDGTCPVCGAPREMLVPVDENGNDIAGCLPIEKRGLRPSFFVGYIQHSARSIRVFFAFGLFYNGY